MLVVFTIVLFLLILFGPQIWAGYIMKRYNTPIEEIPGTGGELAQHLLNRFEVNDTSVEETKPGNDHYDPQTRTVSLSPDHFTGKSLTAIVIASHEVGHALQHKMQYSPLFLRWKFALIAAAAEKIASLILVTFPLVTILVRIPAVGILMFISGITILILPVILHLITLPVEWDASFHRALPILIEGEYIPDSAIPIAKKILLAAALTYVAASLASLLNFYRWIAILRR
jgi:Zn-dependent membrane protease YugP